MYAMDDPRSVCHICCESNSSYTDAWTEVGDTSEASGMFHAIAGQNRPVSGQAQFTEVTATWNGAFFLFDDRTSNVNYSYHLLTRGHQDEGNVQVYIFNPGDGPLSAAPLNCNLIRN
jgi:hypothetical protein